MMSALRGLTQKGADPKGVIVRDVVWLPYCKSELNVDRGGGGKKSRILQT